MWRIKFLIYLWCLAVFFPNLSENNHTTQQHTHPNNNNTLWHASRERQIFFFCCSVVVEQLYVYLLAVVIVCLAGWCGVWICKIGMRCRPLYSDSVVYVLCIRYCLLVSSVAARPRPPPPLFPKMCESWLRDRLYTGKDKKNSLYATKMFDCYRSI